MWSRVYNTTSGLITVSYSPTYIGLASTFAFTVQSRTRAFTDNDKIELYNVSGTILKSQTLSSYTRTNSEYGILSPTGNNDINIAAIFISGTLDLTIAYRWLFV